MKQDFEVILSTLQNQTFATLQKNRQRGLKQDFRYRSLLGTCQLTQYSLQMPLRDTYEIVKMHCS